MVLAINRFEGGIRDQSVNMGLNRRVIWGWLNARFDERCKKPELWELRM